MSVQGLEARRQHQHSRVIKALKWSGTAPVVSSSTWWYMKSVHMSPWPPPSICTLFKWSNQEGLPGTSPHVSTFCLPKVVLHDITPKAIQIGGREGLEKGFYLILLRSLKPIALLEANLTLVTIMATTVKLTTFCQFPIVYHYGQG